jgi:hypothetical protein
LIPREVRCSAADKATNEREKSGCMKFPFAAFTISLNKHQEALKKSSVKIRMQTLNEINAFTENATMASAAKNCALSLVTCDICTEVFRQPKVLPCQHTFCFDCLQKFCDSCNQQRILRISNFPCPSCRTITHLPPGGLSQFPNDFRVAQICDVIEKLKEEDTKESKDVQGDSCGVCQGVADAFCMQCARNLCTTCIEKHSNNHLFQHHCTVPLKGDRQGLHCPEHKEEVKYYCTECQRGICVVCALTDHNKHSLMDAASALVQQRHTIQAQVKQLRERMEQCEQRAQALASMRSEQMAVTEEHKKQVQLQAKIMIQDIKSKKAAAVHMADARYEELLKSVDEEESSLKEDVEQMTELHDEALLSTDQNQALQLLGNFAQLESRLTAALEKTINQVANPKPLPAIEMSQLGMMGDGFAVRTTVEEDDEEENGEENGLDETDPAQQVCNPEASIQEESSVYETPKAEGTPGRKSAQVSWADQSLSKSPLARFSKELFETDSEDDEVFLDTTSSVPVEEAHRLIQPELQYQHQDYHNPRSVALFANHELMALDYTLTGSRVRKYNMAGEQIASINGDVIKPWSAVTTSNGEIALTDHGDSAVKFMSSELVLNQSWKRLFMKPCGIAVMSGGELVVTDTGSRSHKVSIVLPSGLRVRTFANRGRESGALLSPNYVVVDQHDRIIISDNDNNDIRVFDRLGKQVVGFTWKCDTGH